MIISMGFTSYLQNGVNAYNTASNIYRAARPLLQATLKRFGRRNVFGASAMSRLRALKRRPHYAAGRRKLRSVSRRRGKRRVRRMTRSSRRIPKLPRRSVYNRRRKGIRRGNTGALDLQKRLQAGQTLPEQTFARFYYRATGLVNMGTAVSNIPSTGATACISRTIVMNDVAGCPIGSNSQINQSTDGSLTGPIMYKLFWQSLYEQYMILGSKLSVTFKPSVYPNTIAPSQPNAAAGGIDLSVPVDAQPGYYYMRVNYSRTDRFGFPNDPVGVPIRNTTGSADNFTEDHWPHLRDFLADTTVTWKKDTSSLRTKIHVNSRSGIYSNTSTGVPLYGSSSSDPVQSTVSYELETSNKPITLSVNFSAKKNFSTTNILRNGKWSRWPDTLVTDDRFYVRFGYIGFNALGTVSYHIPIDRNVNRVVDIDIKYFAALRSPLIIPSDYDNNTFAKVTDDIPVVDDDEDVEDIAALSTDEEDNDKI